MKILGIRLPAGAMAMAVATAIATNVGVGCGVLGGSRDRGDDTCFRDLAAALSADEMGGRGIGSAGLEKAAMLLERRFAEIGLEPAEPGRGYRQSFSVNTGVALGRDNRLEDGSGRRFLRQDWIPLSFSLPTEFAGDLVFVGYGIRAAELGYDDYADLDVAGKVVLAMRFEPQEDDDESVFAGRRPTRFSDLRAKALTARELGAAALVLVSPAEQAGEPDKLPVLGGRADGPVFDAGIPVLQVSRGVANDWLVSSGLELDSLRSQIDNDLQTRSQSLETHVRGNIDLEVTSATAANIVGIVRGRGALADQVVVVGAHYDHLGHGGAGSRTPAERKIHNGADDNASGVAALVCGVDALIGEQRVGENQERPRRTLVAIAFSAEELGLGGSAWYVHHPLRSLDETVAMVNLDMVGRVRDGKIFALGSDSAPEWQPLLESAAEDANLTVGLGGDGYGPSDHAAFYARGVPVVHFFSGSHEQYHTPLDDFATLNIEGGRSVSRFLAGTLKRLQVGPQQLSYVASTESSALVGDARSYGSYLGTVPDYTSLEESNQGVPLAALRAGGPADRAGLRAGDRIVKMGGVQVRNLYDMTFVLRDHRPGDTLEVTVVRGEQQATFSATLAKRPVSLATPLGESAHEDHGQGPPAE